MDLSEWKTLITIPDEEIDKLNIGLDFKGDFTVKKIGEPKLERTFRCIIKGFQTPDYRIVLFDGKGVFLDVSAKTLEGWIREEKGSPKIIVLWMFMNSFDALVGKQKYPWFLTPEISKAAITELIQLLAK